MTGALVRETIGRGNNISGKRERVLNIRMWKDESRRMWERVKRDKKV